jgi:hypothetical protein
MNLPMEALALQAGDIVFIAIANPLYRRVGAATGSRATHVGIVFADGAGGWTVAESTIPVAKYTPLPDFLARSDRGWSAVRRLKGGLTAAQVQSLRAECDSRLGIFYHTGFRLDSRRQFCSKLVYESFLSATGIEVGAVQTFSDLLRQRPQTSLWFWRLWFFGLVPWSRRTVTPASQVTSPLLEAVFDSDPGPPGTLQRTDRASR